MNNICYTEVYTILKYMDKTTVMKIPEEVIMEIKSNVIPDYKTNINPEDLFNEDNINKESVDYLCYLDYTYWMNDSEKKEIDKILLENKIEEENIKKQNYKDKELFPQKEIINKEIQNDNEKLPAKVEKKGFISNLIDTFKSFLKNFK